MMNLHSCKILGVDLSYRHTGLCLMKFDGAYSEVQESIAIKNPEFGNGFSSYVIAQKRMQKTIDMINKIWFDTFPNIMIVEMPCFTQSAKSALAIGMLWGMAAQLDCILVEPSALKKWSGSRRGDKKDKVKEVVCSRVPMLGQSSDDNIVDAVGLTLMFSDEIKKQRYETNQR